MSTNSRRRKEAKEFQRGIRNGEGFRKLESAESLHPSAAYMRGHEQGRNLRERAKSQAEERERERLENNERIKSGMAA
jgi:hypothetical protein